MRRALLYCAAIVLAIACGDNITEPIPDRTPVTQATSISSPVAFATTTTEDGLSISTDKDDYQPGDTVHFTGSGWQAGDVLDIVLTDEPLTHDPHTWSVNVEADGMFHDTTYVVDEGDLNVTFTLVATSRGTGRSLTVTFTDAAPTVNSFTINGITFTFPGTPGNPPANNPITVAPGANLTFIVNATTVATNASNPRATWKSTQVAFRGGSIGFGDTPPTVCNEDNVVDPSNVTTTNKTLTVAAPASVGTYDVRVRADQDDGCNGGGSKILLGAVIVGAATSTAISSSQNPSTVGNPVTFTATVTTGSPATPVTTGQVSFKSGGTSCLNATEVLAPQDYLGIPLTYTPSPNLPLGPHIIRACYGGATGLLPSEGSVTQQVNAPSNAAPVIQTIGNQTINEEVGLTFTATANDAPAQTLTWSLSDGVAPGAVPAGATISGAGVFTWTPTEIQGPGDYTFDVCVTDNGTPPLSDCETITVTVNEVNLPPVLGDIAAQNVDEEVLLSFTATATDPDILAGGATNVLTFTLLAGTNAVPSGASITGAGVFSWTPTELQGPGVYKFKVRVTDDGTPNKFDEQEITVTVNEVNKAPELAAIGSKTVNEGSALTFTATATDPDVLAGGATNALTFSLADASHVDLGSASITTAGAFSWTPADDNPSATASDNHTIKVVVTDDGVPNLSDNEQITITVNNVPPTITSLALAPTAAGDVYPITGQPTVKATFTDPGANDTHVCTFLVKDEVLGTTTTSTAAAVTTVLPERKCESPLNAPAAGLYRVTLTVTDDDTGTASLVYPAGGLLIVIYDPSAGFVTGGGWINSPAGACQYAACTYDTQGKATFGFVSKYITQGKDKTLQLTGNTEFQFHAGNLNFKSTSYEWLVVNGGSGRAQYKGVGTVNGGGSFGFILTAYDGSPDKFRIKIWEVGTGYVVYDNKMGQPDTINDATGLGGGSIIIHVPKNVS